MTVTVEHLFAKVRRVAAEQSVTEGVAAMWVMTVAAMAMAQDIPLNLRPAMAAAVDRWYAKTADHQSLEPARVACWRFLDTKNGNSTTIDDPVDVAVRTLICVLWDEADEGSDLATGLDFFTGLANRRGGLELILGLT